MADVATITTTLGAITNAIAIAKTIKNVDADLEKAELKLKIAELIESLADAKISATEFQDLIKIKETRIKELEEAVRFKSRLTRKDGFYFDEKFDKLKFDPYCSHCWESENKAIHLTFVGTGSEGTNRYLCPSCKNKFIRYF